MARLLTIMGSGETAPTMIKTHRRLMDAVGATGPGDAVLLDTPYGFQENADDISTKAQEYFRASVGNPIDVASWRRGDPGDTDTAGTVARERALATVADASYVFTGPGSPTYALEQWRGTPLPALLAEKLRSGGAVTFASAAALTLGVATVPVYEIYKAGFAPWWVEGLDLLSEVGLHVALIPHYDNTEGGHHDTRFCYLGERRLSAIEPGLPTGAWVLGVDEHTALVLDLDAQTATVEGNGTVTLRADGRSSVLEPGTTIPLPDLHPDRSGSAMGTPDAGTRTRKGPATGSGSTMGTSDGASHAQEGVGLGADTGRLVAAFDAAMADRDADGAVAAVLDLEQAIVDWSTDTLQSDQRDRARAALRRMIIRLGEPAAVGVRDPRAVVGPYVEAVLDARVAARQAQQYELADALRDRLTAAGVEVRDTPDGAEWLLGDG